MRSIRILLLLLAVLTLPVMAEPTHRFLPVPRKVFWKGVLTLKVTSFDDARRKALQLAAAHAGNSYSQEVKSASNGRKHGVVYLRVPENERIGFLEDVQALGLVYSEKIDAPDVSEEYVDLSRRQRNLIAEEDQLLTILKGAHHVLEVLQVQGHLFNVRVESERVTSRINEIDLKSDTALFALNFFEPPTVDEPTAPGGAAQFLPRWWQYTAGPMLKHQVHATWYAVTSAILGYVTGLQGNVPNAAWLLVYAGLTAVFFRFVWPGFRPQLQQMVATLQGSDVPWRSVGSGLVCVAVAHLFVSDTMTVVLFSLVVLVVCRQYCQTASGQRALEVLDARGVSPRSVQAVLALPLAISITQAVAPQVWLSYGSMLLHSVLLVAACVFVPVGIRRLRAHFFAPDLGS